MCCMLQRIVFIKRQGISINRAYERHMDPEENIFVEVRNLCIALQLLPPSAFTMFGYEAADYSSYLLPLAAVAFFILFGESSWKAYFGTFLNNYKSLRKLPVIGIASWMEGLSKGNFRLNAKHYFQYENWRYRVIHNFSQDAPGKLPTCTCLRWTTRLYCVMSEYWCKSFVQTVTTERGEKEERVCVRDVCVCVCVCVCNISLGAPYSWYDVHFGERDEIGRFLFI